MRIDTARPVLMGMTGERGRHAGPMSEASAVEELRIKLTHPLLTRRYGLWTIEDADTGEQLTPPMPRVRAEFIASAPSSVGRNVRAVLA
jgi:hypothetical protein